MRIGAYVHHIHSNVHTNSFMDATVITFTNVYIPTYIIYRHTLVCTFMHAFAGPEYSNM